MSVLHLQGGTSPHMDSGATFNEDRTHRYRCWRRWNADHPPLAWLMLNPSTADERILDPTLKRVRAFSIAWGFGGFEVWNLWSLRSTDPKGLWAWLRSSDAGPELAANLAAIRAELPRFGQVVCAWGAFSGCASRQIEVAERTAAEALDVIHGAGVETVCLGQTFGGYPKHPLARGKHRVPDGARRLPYPERRLDAPVSDR